MFMFLLQNLARKGLNMVFVLKSVPYDTSEI